MSTTTIVRTIRVELLKPLNYSWEEVGSVMHRQRSVMHRLMNAAVLACIDSGRKLRDDAPQTAAYREASVNLASFNDWLGKQKSPGKPIEVPSGTLAGIGSIAADAWKRWVKGNGNERIPSFGKGQPIPIRAQESELLKETRGLVLTFNLHATQGSKRDWVHFALAPSWGKHGQALNALVNKKQDWETLALKLDYDKRKKKWYALVSYRQPIQKLDLDPERFLVVHRGMHNFASCMSSSGHWSAISGRKLMAQKKKLKARREDMRHVGAAERGQGAKGHGLTRRTEHCESIGDKEARCVKTFCQQTAARIVQLAKQWGCGSVFIGDYGGIDDDNERAIRRFVPKVPLYQLKMSIKSALELHGLTLHEISESYVSQTCPVCENNDSSAHNCRTGVFHCKLCGFSRPADWVSAKMMLRTASPTEDIYDNQLKQQLKLARSLRARETAEDCSEVEERADSTAQARGQVHSRTGQPDFPEHRDAHDPPPLSSPLSSRERPGGPQVLSPEKGTGRKKQKRPARKPARKRSETDVAAGDS